MASEIEKGIVAILGGMDTPIGAGWITADGKMVLTCAHVINKAGVLPGGLIKIRFQAGGEVREARVDESLWRDEDERDVAFLTLDQPLPVGTQSLSLGSARHSKGHTFESYGYPSLDGGLQYQDSHATGEILGLVPHNGGWHMVEVNSELLSEGFSGTPIFDCATQRVIGMYEEYLVSYTESGKRQVAGTETGRQRGKNWAIPADELVNICQECGCDELTLLPPGQVQDYLEAVSSYCVARQELALLVSPTEEIHSLMPFELQVMGSPVTLIAGDQLMSAIAPCHRLVLGEPGSGKSTLLLWLAENAWEHPERIGLSRPHLPLLLSLRRLAQASGAFEKRATQALPDDLPSIHGLPEDFFTTWPELTEAPWLILLDGLDEVPAGEARAGFLKWLAEVLQKLAPYRAVITCRPASYISGDIHPDLAAHYVLPPFRSERVAEFAVRRFGARATDFLSKLGQVWQKDLTSTPLLLAIAAQVYQSGEELPAYRALFYQQFVKDAIRNAVARGLLNDLGEEKPAGAIERQVQRLERVALKLQESGQDAKQGDLFGALASYLEEKEGMAPGEAQPFAQDYLPIIASRSGLLRRFGDQFQFVHPSFREFMAAGALLAQTPNANATWGPVVSRWQDDHWHEVALFALMRLSAGGEDITGLLKRIWRPQKFSLGVKRVKRQQGLIFVAEAWAGEGLIEEGYCNSVLQALVDMLRRLSLERVLVEAPMIVTLLIQLNSQPGVSEAMIGLAKDEGIEASKRVMIAMLQYRLGREEMIEVVKSIAADKGLPVKERLAVANVLGNMRLQAEAGGVLEEIIDDARSTPQERLEAGALIGALILAGLARDENAGALVSFQSVMKLGELRRSQELLEIVVDDQVSVLYRMQAVSQLGSLDDPELLFPLLESPNLDSFSFNQAIEELSRMGQADRLAEFLERTARTPDAKDLRQSDAVKHLGKLGRVDELERLTRCNDYIVQIEAIDKLVGLGQKERLIDLAWDESIGRSAREKAIVSLAKIGCFDELIALVQADAVEQSVKEAALEGLEETGCEDELVRLFENPEIELAERMRIGAYLGKLKNGKFVVPIILEVARDPEADFFDRFEAINALGRLERHKELKQLSQDQNLDKFVRQSAEMSLKISLERIELRKEPTGKE